MKGASKPPPIVPLAIGGRPTDGVQNQVAFTQVHENRLKELETIAGRVRSSRAVAANDLRTALAEGDLRAVLLSDSGIETPISLSRWRAADGVEAVLTGRIRIALPDGTADGLALIREIDLIEWLSKVSPKPFSHIGFSILVAGDPHNSINGMQREKISVAPASQVASEIPHREMGVQRDHAIPEGGLCRTGSREESAARRNAEMPCTALRQGDLVPVVSLPTTRSPAPIPSLMTACEVLTWIAFGRALTRERLGEGEPFVWWVPVNWTIWQWRWKRELASCRGAPWTVRSRRRTLCPAMSGGRVQHHCERYDHASGVAKDGW
jgi:hypothetical protein